MDYKIYPYFKMWKKKFFLGSRKYINNSMLGIVLYDMKIKETEILSE